MGIELTNWLGYLNAISGKGWRADSDTPLPPTDEEVVRVVEALHDAVLYLFNNTFRACGIAVGDRQSEVNSTKIRDRLLAEAEDRINSELSDARREELAKLESEFVSKKTELDHLFARILKLREMTQ